MEEGRNVVLYIFRAKTGELILGAIDSRFDIRYQISSAE